jgi:tetratricopeptide (TPR) repeat protein
LKESPKPQVKFFWIAAGLILLAGVLIILHLPEITAWRWHTVDTLISKANAQTDDKAKYSYLQQAVLIGGQDPLATQAMAQFWLGRGEVERAVDVYKQGIDNPNYIYLGNLALQAQNYNQAQTFFAKASRDNQTSASLSGESVALYNQAKITEGCDKAVQASKLDLSSATAKDALTDCVVLGGTNAEAVQLAGTKSVTGREAAYILINSGVYKVGEEKLLAVDKKTTGDYVVLARLAAARGDVQHAVELAEQGIALDKSNYALNAALVNYYSILGNNDKLSLYQHRIDELNIVRSVR